MKIKTIKKDLTLATTLFNFTRGALRGTFGKEDLDDQYILLNEFNEETVNYLTMLKDKTNVYLNSPTLASYVKCLAVYPKINTYLDKTPFLPTDTYPITICFKSQIFNMKNKTINFLDINSKDAYTQGINIFYL